MIDKLKERAIIHPCHTNQRAHWSQRKQGVLQYIPYEKCYKAEDFQYDENKSFLLIQLNELSGVFLEYSKSHWKQYDVKNGFEGADAKVYDQ